MRRVHALTLAAGILAGSMLALHATAQDAAGGPPQQGAAGGGQGGGPGGGQGRGQAGPGGGFHLIPRFAVEKLKLSDDQLKQIADLEKETKAKLAKILTADQLKILESARPQRPGGQGGPGGGGGQGRTQGGPGGGGGQGGPGGGGGEGGGAGGPPPQQ